MFYRHANLQRTYVRKVRIDIGIKLPENFTGTLQVERLRVRDSSFLRVTHVVCLPHPVLMGKSRSHRPSEYEILEKSRSPHNDFLKNKKVFFCFSAKKNCRNIWYSSSVYPAHFTEA
jgi:hypothetical protein